MSTAEIQVQPVITEVTADPLTGVQFFGMGKCDVCSGPATDIARDIIEIEPDPIGMWRRYKPGDIHRGCDLHKVAPVSN